MALNKYETDQKLQQKHWQHQNQRRPPIQPFRQISFDPVEHNARTTPAASKGKAK
jgi:hypothetical protein